MTGSSPQAKTRRQQTARAWQLANTEKANAARRTWRLRQIEKERDWRLANPEFIASWFEAPTARKKETYFRKWAGANPWHAARLRHEAASVHRRDGKVVSLRPALARLDLPGQALYGISGHHSQRVIPWPGSGVSRRSWSHAEADVFTQAIAAGLRGGAAVLHVDHDPCSYCVASFAGFAKLLDLDELTVHAKDVQIGTYARGDGFHTASAVWWAAYCRGLPKADRRRLKRDPRERQAEAAIPRWKDGRVVRVQVTTPARTAVSIAAHMPPDARRELGRLLLASATDGAQVRR
jgi:hypothetical protein